MTAVLGFLIILLPITRTSVGSKLWYSCAVMPTITREG